MDHRGPGKDQAILYPIQSSSALSTKARIAEDMRKGLAPPNQAKYKGMRMRKGVNQSEESGSPVISPTKSPQTPFDLPRRTSLPQSSTGQINQAATRKASLRQHSPPPPQPEEPSHDTELEHMDVDQPGFVRSFPYNCHPLICINQHTPFSSQTGEPHSSGRFVTHDNTSAVRFCLNTRTE